MTTIEEPALAPSPKGSALSPPKKPYLTIKARKGWVGINLTELWRFRDLLLSLTARDIKLRYKQTALGVIWVIFQPLIAAGIFSAIFGILANLQSDNAASGKHIPLFVFTFTGLVAWNLFFGIITKVSGILVGNSSLVSKVYFPRVMLPMSGAMGVLVDLGVVMCLLVIMQLFTGVGFTVQYFAAPLMLILVTMLALGIGMWAAAMCVEYRDVAYVMPVMLQFLLFGSPVLYSAEQLASKLHDKGFSAYAWIVYINPLAALLDAWKWSVLSTPFPPMWAFVYSVSACFVALFGGVMIFRRMERNFADVI